MTVGNAINIPLLAGWEQAADVASAVAAVAAMVTAAIAAYSAHQSARSTKIAQKGVEEAQKSGYEERIHRYSSAIQQQGIEMVAGVSAFSAQLQAITEDDPRDQDRTRDPHSLIRESLSRVWSAPGLLMVHVNPAKRLSPAISEAGDELSSTADLTATLALWNLRALNSPDSEATYLHEHITSDEGSSERLKSFVTEYTPAAGHNALQYAEYLLEKGKDALVKDLDAMENSLRTHAEDWVPQND